MRLALPLAPTASGPRIGSVKPPAGEPTTPRVRRVRVGEDRILSLPNVITTARLVCVPVFVWLLVQPQHREWFPAAVLLAVLGSTDWLDGQVARRMDQVTTLGKILDPTADRILLVTAAIGILAAGAVPTAIAVIALAREGLVAVAAIGLTLAGARRIDVQLVGKAAAFGLMCAFPLFLAGHSDVGWHHGALVLGWVAAVIGLTLGWISVIVYIPLARAAVVEGRAATSGSGGPGTRGQGKTERGVQSPIQATEASRGAAGRDQAGQAGETQSAP
jgi:cardiolipin synthase